MSKTGLEKSNVGDRLLTYWNETKGGRTLPLENDINPGDLSEIWDSCFLLHVLDINRGHKDYNYTYLGGKIRAAYESDLDEGYPSPLAALNANNLSAKYESIISTQQPIIDHGEFLNKDKDRVKYHQCLLPFSHSGDRVDAIFGAMQYKIYKKD